MLNYVFFQNYKVEDPCAAYSPEVETRPVTAQASVVSVV